MSIHLVLLALSCGALAAAAAGGPLIGVTGDRRRARQMAVLVSTALVAGNAACLLPGTPAWYSVTLVALTAGGLVWLFVSLLAARAGERSGKRSQVPALREVQRGHLTVVGGGPRPPLTSASRTLSAGAEGTRPRLAVLHGGGAQAQAASVASAPPAYATAASSYTAPASSYAVVEALDVTIVDEEVGRDRATVRGGRQSPAQRERSVVTRRELDTVGPRGSRAQSVSVARGIRTFAPEAGRRRAEGSAFRARAHSADGAVLRAQLRALYVDTPDTPKRLPGTRA